MDPNTTYAQLLETVGTLKARTLSDAMRAGMVADAVELGAALTGWMDRGGFLPAGMGTRQEARATVRSLVREARDHDVDVAEARCPVCGDVIDYCQGHGEIGDPAGHAVMVRHDAGDHGDCDLIGCDDARPRLPEWRRAYRSPAGSRAEWSGQDNPHV